MTPQDLELRKLAQAIPVKDWNAAKPAHCGGWWVVSEDKEGFSTIDDSSDGGFCEEKARFIAAANPAALLSLLDRLQASERSDAESIAMFRKARDEREALRAELEAARASEAATIVMYHEAVSGYQAMGDERNALLEKIEATEKASNQFKSDWLEALSLAEDAKPIIDRQREEIDALHVDNVRLSAEGKERCDAISQITRQLSRLADENVLLNAEISQQRQENQRESSIERMWINQPSTLQPHHILNGARVLMDPATETPKGFVRCYFTEGGVISQMLPKLALSAGWPAR